MNEQQAPRRRGRSPLTRAHRSFWILVGLAVLMAGTLSASLGAAPSPLTGLSVAVSGLVLVACLALAARVMLALQRARSPKHFRPVETGKS